MKRKLFFLYIVFSASLLLASGIALIVTEVKGLPSKGFSKALLSTIISILFVLDAYYGVTWRTKQGHNSIKQTLSLLKTKNPEKHYARAVLSLSFLFLFLTILSMVEGITELFAYCR